MRYLYADDGDGRYILLTHPYGPISEQIHDPGFDVLRYVTDKDNNVIYENEGGLRLWDFMSGTTDIVQDLHEYPSHWTDLLGRAIDKPARPGLYIRRNDHTLI